MTVSAKKLDVQVGDLVEIGARRYEVGSDQAGGIALEPANTVYADELHRRQGRTPVSRGALRRAVW